MSAGEPENRQDAVLLVLLSDALSAGSALRDGLRKATLPFLPSRLSTSTPRWLKHSYSDSWNPPYHQSRKGSASDASKPKAARAWELGLLSKHELNRSYCASAHISPSEELQGLAAVLFLDVDGVLHPTTVRHPREQFDKSCMMLLTEVVSKTKAKIVLSTAWRQDADGRSEISQKLRQYGLACFVSCTPSIGRYSRAREILTWVRKYKPLTWVAVDDLPLLQESNEMDDHFVQTDDRSGLRQKTADQIVHLFKAQQRCLA